MTVRCKKIEGTTKHKVINMEMTNKLSLLHITVHILFELIPDFMRLSFCF